MIELHSSAHCSNQFGFSRLFDAINSEVSRLLIESGGCMGGNSALLPDPYEQTKFLLPNLISILSIGY